MASVKWWIEESNLFIDGELTRETVPLLWQEMQQWQPEINSVELSLKEAKRVDSAGMVLLIHLIQHAKISNCHIMLSFVPDQLKMLFQLSNIESNDG